MVRPMCGVQLKDVNRSKDLMFVLDLFETSDQLAMASSVRWYGHVLRREDCHVLRSALDFEVESKNRRPKRTWKKRVKDESVKVGMRRKIHFCRLVLIRLLLG